MNVSPLAELILASASPRRTQILKKLGLRFKIIPSKIKEIIPKGISPEKLVKKFAFLKARSVAKKLKTGLVIGADTVVVVGREIIGKPKDIQDAKRILKKLSNTKQKVLTGVCIYDAKTKKYKTAVETTIVRTRQLTEKQIDNFAKRHLDKAGAYAVQQESDAFVERIEGDYFNVVGLPVGLVKKLLRKFGVLL